MGQAFHRMSVPDTERRITLTVAFYESELDKIRKLSHDTNTAMSAIVRDATLAYLKSLDD